jgi:hypothetical protein
MRPLSVEKMRQMEWAFAEAMAVLKREGFQTDEVCISAIALGVAILKVELGKAKAVEYLRMLASEVEKEAVKN